MHTCTHASSWADSADRWHVANTYKAMCMSMYMSMTDSGDRWHGVPVQLSTDCISSIDHAPFASA